MDRYAAIRARARAVVTDFEARVDSSTRAALISPLDRLILLADACFQLGVSEDPSLTGENIGQLDLEIDTISYQPGLEEGRRAFTIAHEIGHKALEHPEQKVLDTSSDINEAPDFLSLTVQNGIYRSYNSRSAYELEANVFAIELLAPVDLVRRRLLEQRDWTVEGLAAEFGVSKTAILNQITAALRPPTKATTKQAGESSLHEDPDHDRAVTVKGPALVLAGPGAGKTRILVRRFSRLVAEGVDPRRILALTFSNKAAAEMRERLAAALPDHAHALEIFTFHSLGLELLQLHWHHIGLSSAPKLSTPAELIVALKGSLSRMPLGSFEDLKSPARNLGLLMDAVSRAKDELVSPREFAELAHAQAAAAESEDEAVEAAQNIDAGHFYAAYEELLRREGMLDYGDLIALTVQLLQTPSIGEQLASAYSHILVDEFQDVNFASGRLVKELTKSGAEVWAVGDLRQSIYRFRGASPSNIAGFLDDYPGASVVTLATNYRSVQDIVSCGQVVPIPEREDAKRLPTTALTAHRGRLSAGAAVLLVNCPDRDSEISRLVADVKEDRARYGASGVAVLCRTRANAQRVATALESTGVPTNWSGNLNSSTIFKDVMGMLSLVCGDLRGLVRVASVSEHRLAKEDLQILLAGTVGRGPSALALIHEACAGNISDLSPEGLQTLHKLKSLVGELGAKPTPFHALSSYLFEHSDRCRSLLVDEHPAARRDLTTLTQLCAMAKSFKAASATTGRGRLQEFVDFVEACSQAKKFDVLAPDVGDPDCVNVMTVHGSKGLEWPSVFIPYLAKSKFPLSTRQERVPIPNGLARGHDPADDESEEACLFYVAVTRARDRLTLSRAEAYGKAAKPSPFLESLTAGLAGTGFLEVVQAAPAAPLPAPAGKRIDHGGFKFSEAVPFSALRTFERCRKRFEFTYIYRLSSGDRGFRDFSRVVGKCLRWTCEEAREGRLPTLEEAENYLSSVWADVGPTDHWYEARFRSNAEASLRALHARLVQGVVLTRGDSVMLDCGGRAVVLKLDEIQEGEPPIIRIVHFDKPAKSHLGAGSDHMPALAAEAASQLFPGRGALVKIAYPLRQAEMDPETSTTIIRNRVKKMGELAGEAEAGPYPPKWNDFSCPACPYALICTASDEESEGETGT